MVKNFNSSKSNTSGVDAGDGPDDMDISGTKTDVGGHLIVESSGTNQDVGGHLIIESTGKAPGGGGGGTIGLKSTLGLM